MGPGPKPHNAPSLPAAVAPRLVARPSRPIQGPQGHPTLRSRAHLCLLATLRVNHSPLPASSCWGLWATREQTAALPTQNREPQRAHPIFLLLPQGQLWTPSLHGLGTKGAEATPRHRRTDQSQRTKHTMTTTRSKGLSPAPRGAGCALQGREEAGEEEEERRKKGTGLPNSPCA